MHPVKKPTWQQATALVSLSTCGAMTGFSFTHGTVADVTSPTSMPAHLLDFKQPARTASASAPAPAAAPASASAGERTLRSAIVNVANYYLRMAQTKTPAEMEAVIWQSDSVDGVDHGESCAAFASLTLELGAKAVGQESWVTGGGSYPWPLQSWADVRVDPNPASPNVISVLQDAESQNRWRPLGDGYQPQPGDWVLFDDHVEVVTKYSGGVLYTIGGDSLPNFSVNAHQYSGPLADQGVAGFVNNGDLLSAQSPAASQSSASQSSASQSSASQSVQATGNMMTLPGSQATSTLGHANQGQAAIPGTLLAALSGGSGQQAPNASSRPRPSAGTPSTAGTSSTPSIPGVQSIADDLPVLSPTASNPPASSTSPASSASRSSTSSSSGYRRNNPPSATTQVPDTATQQAFISQVSPGAMAAQTRYGIPAAVTIAQAIEESGWGQSVLAVRDHNLFGIKGTGPAGADMQPTREYENGQWLTQTAAFKIYHNVAESIADHSQLLATGPSYQQAMADRHVPDAFAADLTGVYATDPNYGTNLIALMKLYNLYRYDAGTSGTPQAASASSPTSPSTTASPNGTPSPNGTASPNGTPSPNRTASPNGTPSQGGTSSRSGGTQGQGGATIPGILDAYTAATATTAATTPAAPATTPAAPATTPAAPATTSAAPATTSAAPATRSASARKATAGEPRPVRRPAPRIAPRAARAGTRRYVPQIPRAVTTDFITTAKAPLTRAEPLYQDVATRSGIRWELLAACDWMQCRAQPRNSPVHGEKLGTTNSDGTVYRTKSEALAQCANDLIELAMAVYWIDITARRALSVRNLANVFAAFRWGGLLKLHNISAMEFPYSVEGLTTQHLKMRWPDIRERNAPDKPGSRFRPPFGAVPVVLSLNYPAVDELSAART